jgi:lysine 2,3-aminomutase
MSVHLPFSGVTPSAPEDLFALTPDTDGPAISHIKPPVDPASLAWRELRRDAFWQQIPLWKDVDEATFLDTRWQEKHAITRPKKLLAAIGELVDETFMEDIRAGFRAAPMAVRISPYLLALIDWSDPVRDPLRRQFLPLASQLEPDHPMLTLDSLHEQADAPVPGLTHRYPDKALFLTLDTCPVYCRFCTRSYAVGTNTEEVEKVNIRVSRERWQRALRYVAERPELEDIVISGGDSYRLKAEQILEIGHALLNIPHVRRFRFATKGLAIMPMKILTDQPWVDAITRVTDRGRSMGKEVCIHTHFNHPNEVTGITQDAMQVLFGRGITVRNQSVFQRGVNDHPEVMTALTKRLSYVNVQSYYVYVHDLVRGTEDLRTTVATAVRVEKRLRGVTAGYNTPMFVVDAPGGGGKRDAHSYEHYDRETGISVYAAPSVKKDQLFTYVDPMRSLSPDIQAAWHDPQKRDAMMGDVLAMAKKRMI